MAARREISRAGRSDRRGLRGEAVVGAAHRLDHARRSGAALAVQKITPIPTTSYPTPATRPLNSRLDTQRLRSRFGLHLADWRDGVTRMLAEIG